MRIGVLVLQDDVSPAQWVTDRIHTFGENVASLVPEGFEAYARIFHPALTTGEERSVSWAAIATANGREAHAEMQFPNLTGQWPHRGQQTESFWNHEPDEGCLPRDIAPVITAVLAPFTTTPGSCWFCVWDGFGGSRLPGENPHKVELPHRSYHLLQGPIDGIKETFHSPVDAGGPRRAKSQWWSRFPRRKGGGWFRLWPAIPAVRGWQGFDPVPTPDDQPTWEPWQSANLWWPDDRAWFVATEIDLMSTYVGGTRACIDALLGTTELEVLEAQATHGIGLQGDRINPTPLEPYR